MRTGKRMLFAGAAAFLAAGLLAGFTGTDAVAGPRIRLAEMEGGDGGGTAVNLTVRQVTIRPVRAYVGDVVRIEVWIDNREDGSMYTSAEILANRKVVGRQLFRWGGPGEDRTYKLYFDWDTSGLAPGAYKIRADAFVHEDIDSFDNEFTVKQPVLLAAPGGEFPGGEKAGGSITEIDERYR